MSRRTRSIARRPPTITNPIVGLCACSALCKNMDDGSTVAGDASARERDARSDMPNCLRSQMQFADRWTGAAALPVHLATCAPDRLSSAATLPMWYLSISMVRGAQTRSATVPTLTPPAQQVQSQVFEELWRSTQLDKMVCRNSP
jgi:hypothetical protein